MSGAEREMTLTEYLARLHSGHAAVQEVAALREKLAEAEALLRECEPNLDEGMETEAWRSLVRRIDAFLTPPPEVKP